MEIQVQASEVFEWNWLAKNRFVINQGGTRSGKTYSILQVLILKAVKSDETLLFTICRKTFPSLKKSVYRDFISILESMGLYSSEAHNKSSHTYQINNSVFEFISIDKAEKYRGAKRDFLYLNEANEFSFEDVFQLQIRTSKQIYIDFNPSDEASWIYDLCDKRKSEVNFFKSTYLNNPFLEKVLINEIERLKETDDDYWLVYGLGERGKSRDLVYQFEEIEDIPVDEAELVGIGLDFGFSHDPTAVLEVWKKENNLYINELVYKRNLTNSDIDQELKALGVNKQIDIVADAAEPKSIEELRRFGYRVQPAKKGPDSILNGIDILKRHKLFVTSQSLNVITEFKRYKWLKDVNGNLLNKPIDAYNHALDALRYLGLNHLSNKNKGAYNITIGGMNKLFPVAGEEVRETIKKYNIR
jgi:phage terminase large subunit